MVSSEWIGFNLVAHYKISTIEGQVLDVSKRKANSGNWAHGVILKSKTYTLFSKDEFSPVRSGDYVKFSYQTRKYKKGTKSTYYSILFDTIDVQDIKLEGNSSAGYVYVLTNKAMPKLVKIGYTNKSPSERAAELSSTSGVPKKFEVAFSQRIYGDAKQVEQACHAALTAKRSGKEFFSIPVIEAKRTILKKYQELYPESYKLQGAELESRHEELESRRETLEELRQIAIKKIEVEKKIAKYKASPEYKWKKEGQLIIKRQRFNTIPEGLNECEDGCLTGTHDRRTFLHRIFDMNRPPDWLHITVHGYATKGLNGYQLYIHQIGFLNGKKFDHLENMDNTKNTSYNEAVESAYRVIAKSSISNCQLLIDVPTKITNDPELLAHEKVRVIKGNYYTPTKHHVTRHEYGPMLHS